MSYNISEEYLSEEKIAELFELAKLHNDEVGEFEGSEFTIDTNMYMQLQDMDIAKAFIARDIETLNAVGYIIYLVMPHPHFKDILIAKEDGLFVDKQHRGSMLGYKLIKYADKVLSDKYGVDAITQTATEKFDHSKMLIKLGYSKIETTYMRRLK